MITIKAAFTDISIHVPRAGDDARRGDEVRGSVDISIHVPRAGDDTHWTGKRDRGQHFNPRPPCGGRHQDEGKHYFTT